jgi:hypothetical protein
MNRTISRRRPLGEYIIFLVRTFVRLGLDESDFKNGGSERLIDSIVAWGDLNVVGNRIRAHQSAGADHVCIQALAATRSRFRQQNCGSLQRLSCAPRNDAEEWKFSNPTLFMGIQLLKCET